MLLNGIDALYLTMSQNAFVAFIENGTGNVFMSLASMGVLYILPRNMIRGHTGLEYIYSSGYSSIECLDYSLWN